MWAVVTPYSRQCGPPELLATLPPTEHDCWLEGSGAKCSPRGATARDRSRLSTPGWTQASRCSASTSRMRFILVVTITTGGMSPAGVAPPASPVPEPRGTNGPPWSRQTRTAAATSAVVSGKHTTAASPVIMEASRRYRPSSVGLAPDPVGRRARPGSRIRAADTDQAGVAASAPSLARRSSWLVQQRVSGRRAAARVDRGSGRPRADAASWTGRRCGRRPPG